jgi:REP element-mobilizing transposase RayT
MASTYTSLAYHIIFSTKYRKPTLTDAIRDETCRYIAGIIANKQGQLLETGGVEDHVHLLTTCSPQIALADLVRDIKANSSKWLHEEKRQAGFAWQTGYSAFTVSRSQIDSVREYIRGQAEHHQRQSFEDELRTILRRHGIVVDEKYLFEDEHHA